MYKKQSDTQLSLEDFNQPMGLTTNPANRWVQKATLIPWSALEDQYAALFESDKSNVAKPFRMAFGALLIQQTYDYSDEETVQKIQESPYLQFFVGLLGYKNQPPFEASSMMHFRKRLTEERLIAINEIILTAHEVEKDDESTDDDDARRHAENIIDALCEANRLKKLRTYRRSARKDYLAIAKRKKKLKPVIRKAIRKQLGYVARDVRHIYALLNQRAQLTDKQTADFEIIRRIQTQQQFMYATRTHRVEDRIVSFHQPFLQPIVRGKVRTPTEFGAKLDLSQANGFVRIERLSFDAFNESENRMPAIERYHARTGHYPERLLVDQICRTRENRNYCKQHNIRLSGPKLGRPKKDDTVDKNFEYQDNRDRIQVEHDFSLAKRCHGLGLIRTKLATTTCSTIALAIFSLNLFHIQRDFLCRIFGSRLLDQFDMILSPKKQKLEKVNDYSVDTDYIIISAYELYPYTIYSCNKL